MSSLAVKSGSQPNGLGHFCQEIGILLLLLWFSWRAVDCVCVCVCVSFKADGAMHNLLQVRVCIVLANRFIGTPYSVLRSIKIEQGIDANIISFLLPCPPIPNLYNLWNMLF